MGIWFLLSMASGGIAMTGLIVFGFSAFLIDFVKKKKKKFALISAIGFGTFGIFISMALVFAIIDGYAPKTLPHLMH